MDGWNEGKVWIRPTVHQLWMTALDNKHFSDTSNHFKTHHGWNNKFDLRHPSISFLMVTDVLFLWFLHTDDALKSLALAPSLSLLAARMISATLLGAVGRASSPLLSINIARRFKRWPYPNWQMGNSPPPKSHEHTHASFLFTSYFPSATFVSVYTKDWSHQLWNIVQMGCTPEWVAAGGYCPIFTFIFVGQIWRSPACLFHHAGLALKRRGKITPSNTVGEL